MRDGLRFVVLGMSTKAGGIECPPNGKRLRRYVRVCSHVLWLGRDLAGTGLRILGCCR